MKKSTDQLREIEEVLQAKSASDGDGVKLLRVFGGKDLSRFDPFLMLDEFGSYDANDYIGGFPSHPHRGFETITYMLEGKMEHRDHMKNVGILEPGDVQWMKAGSGVIHSEMPKQEEGRMRGFQLWLNLPASEKMTPATYEDIPANKIPKYNIGNTSLKAIAGNFKINGQDVSGAVDERSTEPGYLDIQIASTGDELDITVPNGHVVLVYVYEGEVIVGKSDLVLGSQTLVRLSKQGTVKLKAGNTSKLLLMSGKPINEAIVQHGPFVMNTRAEVNKAISDYQQGRLVN